MPSSLTSLGGLTNASLSILLPSRKAAFISMISHFHPSLAITANAIQRVDLGAVGESAWTLSSSSNPLTTRQALTPFCPSAKGFSVTTHLLDKLLTLI